MFIPKLASECGSQSLHFYGFWSLLMCAMVKMWWALVISSSLMGWESPFLRKKSQTFDHGKYYIIYIYRHIILHLEYLIICYLKGLAQPHGTPPVTQHDTDFAEHRRGGSAAVSQLRWAQRSATRAGSGSSSWTSKAHSFRWGRGMRLGSGWTWVKNVNMGNYG